MNIFHSLNECICYIEENLFEERIDFDKVCKILGTNLNNFKNTFSLLTGHTLNEYIKLRRLSECTKFLPYYKVIDVAIMCGYNSRAVFSRAFKSFHGFNPSDFNAKCKFNYLSRIVFNEEIFPYSKIKFQLKKLNMFTLYGQAFELENEKDISVYIKSIKEKHSIFNESECYYGLVYKNRKSRKILYYIALDKKFDENNKVIKLPASNYLSALLMSPSPKDISLLGKAVKSKSIYDCPDIEIYRRQEVEVLYKV